MNVGSSNIKPGWITGRRRLSEYSGLSVRRISRLMAEGEIPHRRLGHRSVLFRIQDIDRFLMGQKN